MHTKTSNAPTILRRHQVQQRTGLSRSTLYPVIALPPVLRDAVTEAQSFVQSPAALVACSALAALSLADAAPISRVLQQQ